MTTPPEGYHPDKAGDNTLVLIGDKWVTVGMLARLYSLAWLECVNWRHGVVPVRSGRNHDDARKEAGL